MEGKIMQCIKKCPDNKNGVCKTRDYPYTCHLGPHREYTPFIADPFGDESILGMFDAPGGINELADAIRAEDSDGFGQ
jgi:hypothetical protein